MNYLAIDTSGKHLTVIVKANGKEYKTFIGDDKVKHSENLMPETEKLFTAANVSVKDLDFISVVVGAGSFTGIRIGISTVKALCFAENKPFLSITSFDTIAYNKSKGKVMAVISAGHGGFYACGYDGEKISFPPRFLLKDELSTYKNEYEFLSAEPIPDFQTEIVSVCDGLMNATEKKADKISNDLSTLKPLYLRKSQAEEGRP